MAKSRLPGQILATNFGPMLNLMALSSISKTNNQSMNEASAGA